MDPFIVTVKNADNGKETPVKIVQHIPTKGRGMGRPKLRPDNFEKLTAQDLIDIFGNSLVTKVLTKPRFSQVISNFSGEALFKGEDEHGNPIPEEDEQAVQKDYSEMFQTLSFRGYTITEIRDRMLEITGDEENEGELTVALNNLDMEAAKALHEELKKLRIDFAGLKRKPKAAKEEVKAPVAA